MSFHRVFRLLVEKKYQLIYKELILIIHLK